MELLFNAISQYLTTTILTVVALALFGGVLVVYKKLPEYFMNRIWKQLTGIFKPHNIENIFNKYSKVTDELNYLIEEFNADRGIILEFHNGDYYSSKLPQWKLTHTYGKAKLGVENLELKIKSLPASLVWDIVGPLLNNSITPPVGMVKLEGNKYCIEDTCTRQPGIFFIEVEKMNGNFTNYFLSRGTQFLIATSIVNTQGNSVGLIVLEFLDNEISNKIKGKSFTACEICRVSKIITSINEN